MLSLRFRRSLHSSRAHFFVLFLGVRFGWLIRNYCWLNTELNGPKKAKFHVCCLVWESD